MKRQKRLRASETEENGNAFHFVEREQQSREKVSMETISIVLRYQITFHALSLCLSATLSSVLAFDLCFYIAKCVRRSRKGIFVFRTRITNKYSSLVSKYFPPSISLSPFFSYCFCKIIIIKKYFLFTSCHRVILILNSEGSLG